MFKYTTNTLKKIEELYKELAYTIRYEKGNFHAGYCVLEHKKVIVVNRYFDTEGRINSLMEILAQLETAGVAISDASEQMLKEIQTQTLKS
jgi:hypothetical protein